jgi:hypothetical protein
VFGVFIISLYIRPNFFPEYPSTVPDYTGNVLYPVLLYTHNTTALFMIIGIVITLILLWALHDVSRSCGCVVLSLIGAAIFICCVSIGADDDIGSFDFIHASRIMNQFIEHKSLQVDHKFYRLVLGEGLIQYQGGYSGNYGLIVFECDISSIFCHAVATKTWGTEDPYGWESNEFKLKQISNGVEVVFGDEIIVGYSAPN